MAISRFHSRWLIFATVFTLPPIPFMFRLEIAAWTSTLETLTSEKNIGDAGNYFPEPLTVLRAAAPDRWWSWGPSSLRPENMSAEEIYEYSLVEGDIAPFPPSNTSNSSDVRNESRFGSMIIDPALLQPVLDSVTGEEIGVGPFTYPRHRLRAKNESCPADRFIYAGTSGFGQHHNQLQEIINVIALAHLVNRTVILVSFDFRGTKPVQLLYNFTEIKKRYCVVDVDEAAEQLGAWQAATADRHVSAVYISGGEGELGIIQRRANFTITSRKESFDSGRVHSHLGVVKSQLLNARKFANVNIVGMWAAWAFHGRAELLAKVRIFRHLKPATGLAHIIALRHSLPPHDQNISFFESKCAGLASIPRLASKSYRDWFANVTVENASRCSSALISRKALLPLISLHVRYRDGECPRELSNEEVIAQRNPDMKFLFTSVSSPTNPNESIRGWDFVRMQCPSTPYLVDALLTTLPATEREYPPSILMFSDRQAEPLPADYKISRRIWQLQYGADLDQPIRGFETGCRKAGLEQACTFPGDHWGLMNGLAIDFFTMARSRFFMGNQLSSVSQNVCFIRLGNGLSCDGLIPILSAARHLAGVGKYMII